MSQTVTELATEDKSESNMQNNNNILPSSVVVCADENLFCELQGEAVVLNLKSGTYFGLNPWGTRIWELIREPTKVSNLLQELLNEYEVDASRCEAELLSFLKQLHANDLIEVQATNEN